MKYDVWIVDFSGKTTVMRTYVNYKSAKKVAKLFASDRDIYKVIIYGQENVKDKDTSN